MTTVINDAEAISIPSRIKSLASFRRWSESEEFPESGRICFLQGEVWVDMSKEQVFTHLAVKNEYAYVLTGLAKLEDLGMFFPDGLFLTHPGLDFSVKPDGTFVLYDTLESGLARLVEGAEGGFVELEGTPDMVLEIISRGSVLKDTVTLRDAYWEAGIAEYWLVDARRDPIRFDIFRSGPKGYITTKKVDGWLKSRVFGKSFQLQKTTGERGYPVFLLAVQ